MAKTKMKYYKYEDVGKILGCGQSRVDHIMYSYHIITEGYDKMNPTTYKVKIITDEFRTQYNVEYRKYFRERDVKCPDGKFRSLLEVSELFFDYILLLDQSLTDAEEELKKEQETINAANQALQDKYNKQYDKMIEDRRRKQAEREAEFDKKQDKKVNK